MTDVKNASASVSQCLRKRRLMPAQALADDGASVGLRLRWRFDRRIRSAPYAW